MIVCSENDLIETLNKINIGLCATIVSDIVEFVMGIPENAIEINGNCVLKSNAFLCKFHCHEVQYDGISTNIIFMLTDNALVIGLQPLNECNDKICLKMSLHLSGKILVTFKNKIIVYIVNNFVINTYRSEYQENNMSMNEEEAEL